MNVIHDRSILLLVIESKDNDTISIIDYKIK